MELRFHVFYNQIPWILTAQAFFTFLGNSTLAIAATEHSLSATILHMEAFTNM